MGDLGIAQSFAVPAAPDAVWAFLWDIEEVARCIPGCHTASPKDSDRTYTASVRSKIGPFLIRMQLNIEVLEKNPPKSIVVEITGDDQRLKSHVRQLLKISLSNKTEDETIVEIQVALLLKGVLASLSRPLIEMQVRQVLNEFAEAFRTHLGQNLTNAHSRTHLNACRGRSTY